MIGKKLLVAVMGGVVALGLLGGAAVSFAQTETPEAETPVAPLVAPSRDGGRLSVDDQALADTLGITLDELETAEEAARIAMIDQAVIDGLLTEEEAAALKLLDSGLSHTVRQFVYDKDEYLAAALGITVEALQTAELTAYRTLLDEAVAAGTITQEEADLLLARKAAKNYLDTDALNAAVRTAYGEALAAAVAAGDITQAQADALSAQLATQTFDFGFGGSHGHGHGGGRRGGPGGFGFGPTPDTAPETTPDADSTTTDTAFDA